MSEISATDQHRLVILGSMHEFVQLVDMARARGYYTIVCDGYPDGPAKAHADKAYDINIRDAQAVADMCATEQADGIITAFSDVLAECYAEIAVRAGLEPYLVPEKLDYLRDKSLMKQMFDQLQVPYPKTAKVTRENIADAMAGMQFPCITKPANAWGSHGVVIVRSVEEILGVYDDVTRYSDEDFLLVEEYNDGFEFNMMNWVSDGEPVVLEIADREKTQEDGEPLPHVSRIVYPSALTDQVLDEARDIVARVVHFLGYDNGPLCMQFFWSPERGIQVCECAGRIFGYEHELLEIATKGGLSIEELLLDRPYDKVSIAKKLAHHDPHLPAVAAGLYYHAHEGVFREASGLPQTGDPGVVECIQYAKEGMTISHEVGDLPYFARVYLCADERADVDAMTDELNTSVVALDVEGRSMLYPNARVTYDEITNVEL